MEVTTPLTKEQLALYLLRIRLQQPDAANLTTLEAVVHGHTHAIPFENLSLTHPLAIPPGAAAILMDQQAVFDKLVIKQRGGYCFEVRMSCLMLALTACMVSCCFERLSSPPKSPGQLLHMCAP